MEISRDAEYARPLSALKQVLAEKARHVRNTFYISPVCYFNNGASNAMVYWREGRALILWEPDRPPPLAGDGTNWFGPDVS